MSNEKVSICAVITVRNEFQYLRILLPVLAQQGIEVIIIDNGSTDNSTELYAQFMNYPIIKIKSLPYKGYFSVTDHLAAKDKVIRRLSHDWIIHHDADEIFEHYKPGLSVRDAIQEADDMGFTVLNFEEFVFLPEPGSDYTNKDYYQDILRYYYFEPLKNRLNRAWKRSAKCKYKGSGGHSLTEGIIRISPENHILRHYVALSEDHVKTKYLNRQFDKKDLKKRWHGNRRNISEEDLKLPDNNEFIFNLKTYDSKDFCKKKPLAKHFWQWNTEQN